jgi:hypothetical protein
MRDFGSCGLGSNPSGATLQRIGTSNRTRAVAGSKTPVPGSKTSFAVRFPAVRVRKGGCKVPNQSANWVVRRKNPAPPSFETWLPLGQRSQRILLSRRWKTVEQLLDEALHAEIPAESDNIVFGVPDALDQRVDRHDDEAQREDRETALGLVVSSAVKVSGPLLKPIFLAPSPTIGPFPPNDPPMRHGSVRSTESRPVNRTAYLQISVARRTAARPPQVRLVHRMRLPRTECERVRSRVRIACNMLRRRSSCARERRPPRGRTASPAPVVGFVLSSVA